MDIPESKPWVNGEVHTKLNALTDAYSDLEEYRKSRYALQRAISNSNRQYRDKVESNYQGSVEENYSSPVQQFAVVV